MSITDLHALAEHAPPLATMALLMLVVALRWAETREAAR